MRFEYSPYELNFLGRGTRAGVLVRIEVGSDWGYADLHPWVERGDLPLEQELSEFSYGSTRLGRRAMVHALCYGEQLAVDFENHALLLDGTSPGRIETLRTLGFRVFKFKVRDRSSFENLLDVLPALEGAILRLDWNVALKVQTPESSELSDEFERLLSRFQGLNVGLDFVEDPPLAIDSGIWAEDFTASPKASIRILKPAVMEPKASARRTIVTSYLGHPVGQWADARAVGGLELSHETHGLCSHLVYEQNVFSEELGPGPRLRAPEAWDHHLRKLTWKTW